MSRLASQTGGAEEWNQEGGEWRGTGKMRRRSPACRRQRAGTGGRADPNRRGFSPDSGSSYIKAALPAWGLQRSRQGPLGSSWHGGRRRWRQANCVQIGEAGRPTRRVKRCLPATSAKSTSSVVSEQKRGRPGSLLLEGVAGSSMRCGAVLKDVEHRCGIEGERGRARGAGCSTWRKSLEMPGPEPPWASPPVQRLIPLRSSSQGRGGARHRRPELAPSCTSAAALSPLALCP